MKLLIILMCVCSSLYTFSQETKSKKDPAILRGNSHFKKEKYRDAEHQYRTSASTHPTKSAGNFNLGNSLYRLDKSKEAMIAYTSAIEKAITKEEKHKAYHNLGNAYMKEKEYAKAVETFKNALRNNPRDEETRYNYALAKELLKNNPEDPKDQDPDDQKKNQNKDQDNEDNQEQKNKDQDDKQENKPQEQPNEGQNKNEQQRPNEQDNSQQQPSEQQGGMSKEQMQNLLEAVNNEERKIQEKVKVQQKKGVPVRNEKDW